jgi:selenide,water dikinase
MSAVPLLPGLCDLVTGGFIPGGARRNLAFVERRLQVETGVSEDDVMILCDPQTSGGLLFAVDGQRSATLVRELEAEKVATIAEVGEVNGPDRNERQIHIVP